MIRSGHQQRDQIQDILNPVNGYRGQQQLRGEKPTNHMAANKKALQSKQEEFKRKQDEMEMASTKERWVMSKFKNVPSKVQAHGDSESVRPTTEGAREAGDYAQPQRQKTQVAFGQGRASARNLSSKQQNSARGSQKGNSGDPGSGLTRDTLTKFNRVSSATRTRRDSELQIEAGKKVIMGDKPNARRPPMGQNAKPPAHKNYGKVPKYIEKYNEERAAKEEVKEQQRQAARRPPGTRQMEEDERIKMLESLQESKAELARALQSMPISMRTESLQKQKTELEQKLDQVEKSIALFSRKVVFIAE